MAKDEIDLGTAPDGTPITSIAVSLNVGSGLNAAVEVQPIQAKAGDTLFIAVKAQFVKDRYDYEFDDNNEITGCEKVLMLSTRGATFVDGKTVQQSIQSMTDRIAEHEQSKRDGQKAFEFDETSDDEESNVTPIAKQRKAE
jgi:hypothetical protein